MNMYTCAVCKKSVSIRAMIEEYPDCEGCPYCGADSDNMMPVVEKCYLLDDNGTI